MSQVLDFLGNELKIGDEVILAGLKRFKKRIIHSFVEKEEGWGNYKHKVLYVGVKSSNTSKPGYTFPQRLIKQQ